MKDKDAFWLFGRYFLLLLLGLFNIFLFYWIFTPLTIYPVYYFLSLIYGNVALLTGGLIFIDGFYIQIIPACVAGAAYYLLIILNLSTPMKLKKRIESLAFLMGLFLAANIIRILVFANIAATNQSYFEVAHQLTWYFGSTLIVVAIWFVNVWLFRIKGVPVYTDLKSLYSASGREHGKV